MPPTKDKHSTKTGSGKTWFDNANYSHRVHNDNQYMVDFTLPKILSEEFLRLIPAQRAKVNKLFRDGKLINYALSLDNSKMWAILHAGSELDVMEILSELPLTRFMKVKINTLTFYNTVNGETPVFSMN